MKKITLLFFIAMASIAYSQTNTNYSFTFEDGTSGSDMSYWNVFESDTPAPEVVTNPDPDGVNTDASTKVLKLNVLTGNACYAGAETVHGTAGVWQLDASTSTFSMMVNKSTIGRVGIKFVGTYDGMGYPTVFELTSQTNTVVNQWETLTWDISAYAPSVNIDQIVIFTDFTCGDPNRSSGSLTYIDNITFTANKIAEPVLPVYVSSWNVDFETASGFVGDNVTTFAEVNNPDNSGINTSATAAEISGINVGLYSNAQYTLSSGSFFDFAGNDKGFSLKVRGPRAIPVKLKVEVAGNGATVDANYTDVGNWQTLFFDFSAFNARNWDKFVLFFDIESAPSGDGNDDIFYFDDVVFGTFNTLSSRPVVQIESQIFPNPTKSHWLIRTQNSDINRINLYTILGKQVLTMNTTGRSVKIDGSSLKTGLYFAVVETSIGSKTVKLVKN